MTPVIHDPTQSANGDLFGIEKLQEEIPLGLYLMKRLISAGVKSIFGVPGDYNLRLLEYMYDDSLKNANGETLEWIGCCNELNAAYAADGYSRYLNKIGCVLTTYGVGELGAISGVAGACSENVKVLHIVGIIDYEVHNQNPEMRSRNLHHLVPQLKDSNFVGPDYKLYCKMVEDKIACSVGYLDDLTTACDKIDKVIEDIYKYSKPGYIFVPCTFVDELINAKNLNEKPTITLDDCVTRTAPYLAEDLVKKTLDLLYQATTPAIVADLYADRYGIRDELNHFIEKTNIANFASSMGKSIIDESNPLYMGVYNGTLSLVSVSERFLSCDLVLHVGIEKNEVNYGNYSYPYKPDAKVIEFHPTYIRFFDNASKVEEIFREVNFIDVISLLIDRIDPEKLSINYGPKFKPFSYDELQFPKDDLENDGSSEITQTCLQKLIPEHLNPGDVLVSDTGIFQFAIRDFKLPTQARYIAQGFYLSIGMALPAALGIGIAMRDYPSHHISQPGKIPNGYQPKLILLQGDGAAQMTAQELSTMIRYQVPMEIFLWNNSGYTIERMIEGPTRPYNDIAPWKWTKILEAFGDFDGKLSRSSIVETRSQLETKLFELKYKEQRKGIDFVEVILGKMDFPLQLQEVVDLLVQR